MADNSKINACTLFKNIYSTCLLIFCTTMVMGLIFTRQTKLSADVHPALAFIVLWGLIIWLNMVEGGQGSLVGLAPINFEIYQASHTTTFVSTNIAHMGDNLDRYLMGRQFMVIFIAFTISLSGAPLGGSEILGFPKIVLDIFLGSGIAMILMTAMIGQLNSQVNASLCMLDYINNLFAVFTFYVAIAIESNGLMHASYLIQMIVAKMSEKPIISNEAQHNFGQNIFFWGCILVLIAVLCFALAVTLEALFKGQTTMWKGVPGYVAFILLFLLMSIIGML